MERYGNENPGAFQPTRPLRGATLKAFGTASSLLLFQPTRPLRGATCGHRISAGACRISTHAPLAGRDYSVNLIDRFPVISTHAPLAGRDGLGQTAFAPCRIFQPTRPLRGATASRQLLTRQRRYFNPRAPCGARQGGAANMARPISISTHAPLAGRDVEGRKLINPVTGISTHAPLAGRDWLGRYAVCDRYHFNPRAPCGARRKR